MVLAGIGPGSAGQMTLTVMEHMFHSRVLLGAPRMIESALKALDSLEQLFIHRNQNESSGRKNRPRTEAVYQPEAVIRFLEGYQEGGMVTVLFSGDTGFYSGTKKLAAELKKEGFPLRFFQEFPLQLSSRKTWDFLGAGRISHRPWPNPGHGRTALPHQRYSGTQMAVYPPVWNRRGGRAVPPSD